MMQANVRKTRAGNSISHNIVMHNLSQTINATIVDPITFFPTFIAFVLGILPNIVK